MPDYKDTIKQLIGQSADVKRQMLADSELVERLEQTVDRMIETFKNGGKVLLCGNGGSAADAQHIAAELSGRFYHDRQPLYAEALHVNTSYLTAAANDYSFEEVYSRLVTAQGRKGDILIGISTSGNSVNVLKALETARTQKMTTVGLTGKTGGQMASLCDHLLCVPSTDTPRIQEGHILIGHILCQLVEAMMFGK